MDIGDYIVVMTIEQGKISNSNPYQAVGPHF